MSNSSNPLTPKQYYAIQLALRISDIMHDEGYLTSDAAQLLFDQLAGILDQLELEVLIDIHQELEVSPSGIGNEESN